MKYAINFTEGNGSMTELMGGKGARLSELVNIGVPVPQGFVVTTDACREYYCGGKIISQDIENEIFRHIEALEKTSGKSFGDSKNPLLVSVRSSDVINALDFADGIINIGINESTAKSIADLYNNERFSLELYFNFLVQYMNLILDDKYIHGFHEINSELMGLYYRANKQSYEGISNEAIKEFISKSKQLYESIYGREFPEDPRQHLLEAIRVVFNSWDSRRAEVYRRLNKLEDNKGMAAIVQVMAFGNAGSDSAVGYQYTRDPKTGEDSAFFKVHGNTQRGDYPGFYNIYNHEDQSHKLSPQCLDKLTSIGKAIEKHLKNSQLISFVIEKDQPYVIMSKTAKRCVETEAELNIAVSLAREGIITKEEAVSRISKFKFLELSQPVFDKESLKNAVEIRTGFPGSRGVACGKAYFTKEKAREHIKLGEKVIFITRGLGLGSTDEDEDMIRAVEGVITSGGMTADESILSRRNGKPCVVLERESLNIYMEGISCMVNGHRIKEGDLISIDGTNGKIYKGLQKIIPRRAEGNYATLLKWIGRVEKIAD